jgi:uncharacterized membrane protein
MIDRPVAFSAFTSLLALLAACNGQLALEDAPVMIPQPDAGTPAAPDAGTPAAPSPMPDAGFVPPDPAPSSCNDRFENGRETDVDCGGPECPACPVEAGCTGHPDCETNVCRAGSCQPATCDDATKNGDESGVDCGGSCSPCSTPVVACECASSPNLTGLACGPSLDPNGSVYLTPGGESVLFALALTGAYRWEGSTSLKLDTGTSLPKGLSDDGGVMLFNGGYLNGSAMTLAFLLTSGGARTEVPAVDVGALSEDGSVVLTLQQGIGAGVCQRWTLQGCEDISDGIAANVFASSFMTPDGSVFGGRRLDAANDVQLFSWSAGNPAQLRGALPNWYARTRNDGVVISRDGNVIAGFMSTSPTASGDGTNQIFRSTAAGGISVITPLWPSGASPEDSASDTRLWLNDDGSALVGTFDLNAATSVAEPSAFRWTEGTGPVALAATPGQRSIARGASRNLGVVVGYTLEDDRPFVWTEANGLRDLGSVLGAAAVDQTGWVLSRPTTVSRDGKVIVGEGSCNGVAAVYRVVLPD